MEPITQRLDFHAALWTAFKAAAPDLQFITSSGADMNPAREPVTVITEPQATQSSQYSRSVFTVSYEILTYADTEDKARAAHNQAADTALSLQWVSFDGVHGRVATVQCELEPVTLHDSAAPEWPGVLSRYTMHVRTWR